MYRILWVSRHKPLPSQIKELKRLFGEETVINCNHQAFNTAEEIVTWMQRGQYNDIVLVAPLSVIAILVRQYGIRPLWAEMKTVRNPQEAETSYNGRHYRFQCFKRITAIHIQYENITPTKERRLP